jgi:AraC-like DNA-binding protein
VECIFSLLVSIMKRLVPARFAGEIRFSHAAPTDTSEHHRILGPAVRFAARRDEVHLSPAYLTHPIAAADDQLLGVLEQYALRLLRGLRAEPTWLARVSEAIGRDLCDGPPTLPEVARQLGVSQRTLQSRLKEEGTTYQAALDSVRRQLATATLEDGVLSLTEVAFLLGYADQSAFNHAFRRWTEESPRQYNERLKIAY